MIDGHHIDDNIVCRTHNAKDTPHPALPTEYVISSAMIVESKSVHNIARLTVAVALLLRSVVYGYVLLEPASAHYGCMTMYHTLVSYVHILYVKYVMYICTHLHSDLP